MSDARAIAADWHGGQRSSLYSFASTGRLHYHADYYRDEVLRCIKDTYESAERVASAAHTLGELEDIRDDRIDLRRLWRYIATHADKIDLDREEHDSCERGTPGCPIHHTRDTECETW